MPPSKLNPKIVAKGKLKISTPFLNKDKNKSKNSEKRGLEDLIKKEVPISKPIDMVFFEDITALLSKKASMQEIKGNSIPAEFFETLKKSMIGMENSKDYISIARKKAKKEDFAYSISIKYEENKREEKLSIKVSYEGYLTNIKDAPDIAASSKPKDAYKEYSIGITKQKDANESKRAYSVSLVYENNYEEERLSISYNNSLQAYQRKRHESMHDFTDRIPGKHLNTFPSSGNEGLYGFTFLGESKVWRRDDLTGWLAKMVDVHESIHTPDEYETRILTSWIMSKQKPKYVK